MATDKSDEDLEELRGELRRLWAAATQGRWEAVILDGQGTNHLYAVTRDGGRWLLAFPNTAADARLMAAAKNALPRLFREIDRRSAGLPVLGKVGDGGRVTWFGSERAPTLVSRRVVGELLRGSDSADDEAATCGGGT